MTSRATQYETDTVDLLRRAVALLCDAPVYTGPDATLDRIVEAIALVSAAAVRIDPAAEITPARRDGGPPC